MTPIKIDPSNVDSMAVVEVPNRLSISMDVDIRAIVEAAVAADRALRTASSVKMSDSELNAMVIQRMGRRALREDYTGIMELVREVAATAEAAEREACAQACDANSYGAQPDLKIIAQIIRARGNK